MKSLISTATCFVAFSISASFAALVTGPPDLNIGDSYRLVFVTKKSYNPFFPEHRSSDIAFWSSQVMDDIRNEGLSILGLATSWTILASSLTDGPARHISGTDSNNDIGVPIYRLDGMRIAQNYADLWDGSIENPINVTPDGSVYQPTGPGGFFVWTGTNPSGTPRWPFGDGGAGRPVGAGVLSATSPAWIAGPPHPPDRYPDGLPFYMVSDVITVIPEPATATLAALGLLGLVWRRRRS